MPIGLIRGFLGTEKALLIALLIMIVQKDCSLLLFNLHWPLYIPDDIVGLRNKLLLQLGYETMRRRSEICQFKFEDLQHLGNHKHALLLRHSKTDQYNQGKIIPISDELSEIISSWSLAIDQDSGYILKSFKRNLSTNPSITPASINHILKSLQNKLVWIKLESCQGIHLELVLHLTY